MRTTKKDISFYEISATRQRIVSGCLRALVNDATVKLNVIAGHAIRVVTLAGAIE
jgi:hypothetical protein